MQELHDRQPVMMSDDAWRTWLDTDAGKDDLLDAALADAPELAWHEVDKAVGNVRNNSPELVEPVE